MVPSIRALETMHNNLTMKQLLDFLRRATTKKFMNPTPIASPGGSRFCTRSDYYKCFVQGQIIDVLHLSAQLMFLYKIWHQKFGKKKHVTPPHTL
jgi:hypothetical protein